MPTTARPAPRYSLIGVPIALALAAGTFVVHEWIHDEHRSAAAQCEPNSPERVEATTPLPAAESDRSTVVGQVADDPLEYEVEAGLPKPIIARIVRAHINEIRYCYNQLLVRDPEAQGRVTVRFVVGPRGTVASSEIADEDLHDDAATTCIANAVARWKFPILKNAEPVTVHYPFVLSPG